MPAPTDPRRRLLLTAAAGRDLDRARDAWRELRAQPGGEAGVLAWVTAGPEQRLLPMLRWRAALLELGPAAQEACALAEAEAWGGNRRAFEVVGPLVASLTAAGVPVLGFKGIALVGTAYPDHRVRPIGDADLLVPEDRLSDALGVMRRSGWFCPERIGRLDRAMNAGRGLAGPPGANVDLHWRPGRPYPHRRRPPARLWEHARPAPAGHPLAGTGLLVPERHRHLVAVAAHGSRPANAHNAHWMADVDALVGDDAVDAALLAAIAAEDLLSLRVGGTLAQVAAVLGTPVNVPPAPAESRDRRREERMIRADQVRRPVGGWAGMAGRWVRFVRMTAVGPVAAMEVATGYTIRKLQQQTRRHQRV